VQARLRVAELALEPVLVLALALALVLVLVVELV
jgi:hypothetical protein